jgi:hypothetical protein
VGPCKDSNDPLHSIKGEEFLDQLSDYQLLSDGPYTIELFLVLFVFDDPQISEGISHLTALFLTKFYVSL